MNTLPRLFLAEMTREQIRAVAADTTVVLPIASTEQHGPHLPIMTDSLICTSICEMAAKAASAETPVTVAPALQFGRSAHHFPFPGVLSLSSLTMIQVLKEICDSLVRSGFRRIAIINGHGGNSPGLSVLTSDFALEHHVALATESYWVIAGSSMLEEGRKLGLTWIPGHAGQFETSMVLALRPELVDQASYPPAVDRWVLPAAYIQQPSIVSETKPPLAIGGYTDNPASASAELGQRMLFVVVREVARFLVDFAQTCP